MEIRQSGGNELTITGNIKSINDSMAVRNEVERLHKEGLKSIVLRLPESFALPSAVIGYLMKLVNKDKVSLTLMAGDERLRELLDELQLTSMFNVRNLV